MRWRSEPRNLDLYPWRKGCHRGCLFLHLRLLKKKQFHVKHFKKIVLIFYVIEVRHNESKRGNAKILISPGVRQLCGLYGEHDPLRTWRRLIDFKNARADMMEHAENSVKEHRSFLESLGQKVQYILIKQTIWSSGSIKFWMYNRIRFIMLPYPCNVDPLTPLYQ